MNCLRIIVACLLLAVAPLRAYAMFAGCCPPDPTPHANHAHGQHSATQADHAHESVAQDDDACAKTACAVHCAGATALLLDASAAPASHAAPWDGEPGLQRPPAVPLRAPEKPPRLPSA